MKKFAFALIVTALLLSACGSNQDDMVERDKVITLGHVFSESDQFHQASMFFKKQLEERSNGQLTVDIHPNGSLGGTRDLLEQVEIGALDATIGGISYFSGEYPAAMIDEMPYLYKEPEDWYHAMDGELGKAIQLEILDEKGIVNLANWGMGFRHFTNNKRPIAKPEDMAGIKFRSETSTIRLEMFHALQASAISMAFNEVFTGLQQGTIDGQENPATLINSSNLYEVQKYLSLSGHIFTGTTVLFSQDSLDRFSNEELDWIKAALDEATIYQRESVAVAEDEAIASLGENMEINKVDYDAFYDQVQSVYDFYREKTNDNGWIEKAQNK